MRAMIADDGLAMIAGRPLLHVREPTVSDDPTIRYVVSVGIPTGFPGGTSGMVLAVTNGAGSGAVNHQVRGPAPGEWAYNLSGEHGIDLGRFWCRGEATSTGTWLGAHSSLPHRNWQGPLAAVAYNRVLTAVEAHRVTGWLLRQVLHTPANF